MTGLEIAFWGSAALLVYIYAGYPLLVGGLARWFPRPVVKGPTGTSLSTVIVARNEAPRIGAKLESIFRARGSNRIVEVLIGLDNSTDETAAIVSRWPDPRVRLVSFPRRRGKAAVLNDLIPLCRGDVVVLSDGRQLLDAAALDALCDNFADETVGVVSGELVFRDDTLTTTAAHGMGCYWRYEKWIRHSEGRFHSVPGATGAIYAIRRELLQPIDPQTLLDDVVFPMQAVVSGYRCVFEPAAVAYDIPSRSTRQEAVRKRRTIAGCAQLIVNHPDWLLPWRNPIWWQFISHKLLRLSSPVLMLTAAASNLALAAVPAYRVLLALQACLYLSAGVGWLYQTANRRSTCFGPSVVFLALNLTTLAALWDALRSKYQVTWKQAYQWPSVVNSHEVSASEPQPKQV